MYSALLNGKFVKISDCNSHLQFLDYTFMSSTDNAKSVRNSDTHTENNNFADKESVSIFKSARNVTRIMLQVQKKNPSMMLFFSRETVILRMTRHLDRFQQEKMSKWRTTTPSLSKVLVPLTSYQYDW